MIVYGIPNCDTVKRARTWLTEHGQAFDFHDFKKAGVPPAEASSWLAEFGWEKVVNRSGTTWRKLDDAARAGVVDSPSAAALMQAQPSVIKRPIVRWVDGSLTLGFSADAFSEKLQA
ncbi:arsenate reductase [Roseateles koreensis]